MFTAITRQVDIGASIGEFVFSASNYSNVQNIYAFEPRPDCASVLRKMKKINNENRLVIFENIVSVSEEPIFFISNPEVLQVVSMREMIFLIPEKLKYNLFKLT